MSALADRLRELLGAASPDPLAECSTAGDCLDLTYERAYAEDYAGAIRAALKGLEIPDDGDTHLSLWGALASVRHLGGDEAGAFRAARARLALLRERGWDHQADMEADLGSLLFREAQAAELPVLDAALITHESAGAPDHVLADIRLALAVALQSHGSEGAIDALQWCADAYRSAGRAESEGGALLYLAHLHAKQGQHPDAIAAAERLLALPLNRAMKAAVWMVKASSHHALDQRLEAEGCALEALTNYASAGVRKGAVSAAAAVAQSASEDADQEAAVLAWKVAVDQAERGEVDETWALQLALGHQLLDAGELSLAEGVLAPLADRLGRVGRVTARARALVSLGHALRRQERSTEAAQRWEEAAAIFTDADLYGEASRTLVALGTLLGGGEDVPDAPAPNAAAQAHFEQAVALARRAEDDPAALPMALHAYGHALCRAKDPDGLSVLDEAIALAEAHQVPWHAADFRDTHARGRWSLGDARGAVAEALEAADLFRAADDPEAAGNAELFAAHVLDQAGHWDESASLYRLIAAEHADHVAHASAAAFGLAEVLTKQGLPLQAEEARNRANTLISRALDDLDTDSPDSSDSPTDSGSGPQAAPPSDRE